MRDPAAIAARAVSVSSRIKDTARKSGLDTQALLKRYALERFLARLAVSPHGQNFALKGGLIMPLVNGNLSRPTDDIDCSVKTEMTLDEVRSFIAEISAIEPLEEDGMVYGGGTVDITPIREGLLPGARVIFDAALATAPRPTPLRIKLDLCYGDLAIPDPVWRTLPLSLPGVQPTEMLCYAWASVFSEKIHAIYRHGATNTRLKDYMDLISLARNIDFTGAEMVSALKGTFRMWGGTLSEEPYGLTAAFAKSRQREWKIFIKSPAGKIADTDDFYVAILEIRNFALPVIGACFRDEEPDSDWVAGKGWHVREYLSVPVP